MSRLPKHDPNCINGRGAPKDANYSDQIDKPMIRRIEEKVQSQVPAEEELEILDGPAW